tara:strand:+ start:1025 stop:1489 length:465 start_codon:yes stop_codon:yes gene_type:complete
MGIFKKFFGYDDVRKAQTNTVKEEQIEKEKQIKTRIFEIVDSGIRQVEITIWGKYNEKYDDYESVDVKKFLNELVIEKKIIKDGSYSGVYYFQSKAQFTKMAKAQSERKKKAQKRKEKRRNELIKKYGEKFGEAILRKKLLEGMTKEMVIEAIG